MPKRIVQGTGMREQEYISYDTSENATQEETRALKEHLERWSRSLKGHTKISKTRPTSAEESWR